MHQDRYLAQVAGRYLSLSCWVWHVSILLSVGLVISCLFLPVPWRISFMIAGLLSLFVALYLVSRVQFDAQLFLDWGQSSSDLQNLDDVLVSLGLLKQHPVQTRTVLARIQGAKRLFTYLQLCVAFQTGLCLSCMGLLATME